jgi:tetratricopeptide (TPR) repeat protein
VYEQDGDMSKLAEVVNRYREALSLHPQGHHYHAISLSNLANALLLQHRRNGDITKLAEMVDLQRKALSLRPQGHPDRATSLNNLALALLAQFKQDHNTEKLAEMVDMNREALSLRPQHHPDRDMSLNNLACALRISNVTDRDTSKLAETVDLVHEALSLHPKGHPSRAISLNNLGCALRMQYQYDGDPGKLAKTVDLHREALSLRPQGHPYHGDSLDVLSGDYYAQFDRNSDESALVNALKLQRECLNSWLPGHPTRYGVHYSIAYIQLLDTSLFDWAEALNHLIQAITDNSASSRQRLIVGIASLRFVEQASFRDVKQYFQSQQVLDLYIQAIQLLPRVAHTGLNTSARLRELSGSEQLCRAAAMRATLLDQLPIAVEVFEEGKAVFWSQALRLRSTALDTLPTVDNERLRHLFQSLDVDHSGSSTQGLEKEDLERHIEYRRKLNDEVERLIEDIRRRPGFERFLRIPKYTKLAEAASRGFVVALVANEPFIFAIIIQAGEGLQHVPLPSVDRNKLRRLIELTSGPGMRDLSDERATRQRLHPRLPLEQIWLTIVKPVLLHLGLQVRHNRLI